MSKASVTSRSGMNFTLVHGLRGFASMWVVLFHAREGHHIDTLYRFMPEWLSACVFDQGHNGVPIFFALSGFVIAHSIRDFVPSIGNFLRFVAKRALRLDPPYWLSIVVVLALGFLSSKVKGDAVSFPDATNIFSHLFYLQIILGEPLINSVYWTLTYEVQFYIFFVAVIIVFAFILRDGTSYRDISWVILGVCAIFCSFVPSGQFFTGIFLEFWPSFFIGALAYRASAGGAVLYLFYALAAILIFGNVNHWEFVSYSVVTSIVLNSALRHGFIFSVLKWRWLQFLGTVSYSLYLLHNPVSGAAGFLVHKVLGQGLLPDLIALGAIVIASVVAAFIFWWMIERPAQSFSKMVKLRTSTHER